MLKNEKTSTSTRILDVLSSNKNFICLSGLAKAAGFNSAASKDFKQGLNNLIEQGIVKVRQSGWPSELRGTGRHEKTVILLSEVMEFLGDQSSNPVSEDHSSIRFSMGSTSNVKLEQVYVKPGSFQTFLKMIAKCHDCKEKPVAYITQRELPVCYQHSNMLANSNVSFPE